MSKVVIIQRVVPHYRVPFFRGLKEALAAKGLDFILIYGREQCGSVPKSVDLDEPWVIRIDNRYLNLPIGELVWQPCLSHLGDADLVIVEQANRLLLNYWLQFVWRGPAKKLAFWGHGTNFQSKSQSSLDNRFKRWLTGKVDWWFAYTDLSLAYVQKSGFAAERISVVQNCIDCTSLQAANASVTQQQLSALHAQLGLQSDHIGLYCGGLYADKRLDFLLESVDRIKARIEDFEFIVIGDGPESGAIQQAAQSRPWLHYVGPVFGDARVPYFKLAKVLLMPGLVGLVIIDSFVLGTPLFTTDNGIHSPEIAYLLNGVNGVMADNSVTAYVDNIVNALSDEAFLTRLQTGCRESAKLYTLDEMVKRYSEGICHCLSEQ